MIPTPVRERKASDNRKLSGELWRVIPGMLGFFAFKERNSRIMLIKVIYRNNESDMVKPFLLDDLIASGKVIKFFRSGGWVTVGVDPVRGDGGGCYRGPERRKNSLLELWKWYREEFSTRIK